MFVKEYRRLLLLIASSIILILMGLLFGQGLFSIAAFALCAISFVLLPSERIVYVLCVLISFNTIFKYSAGSISLMTILELFAVIIMLIRAEIKFKKREFLIALLFIAVMIFGDILHSQFTINEYVRQFVNFSLFVVIINKSKSTIVAKNVILFFVLGIIASSVVALYAPSIELFYTFVRKVGLDPTVTNRFGGLIGDPNYYSVHIILALAGCIALYKNNYIKTMFWILFIILSVFGFLTYSKSFFLMWIVIDLVIFGLLIKKRFIKGFLVFSLLFIIGVVVINIGQFNEFSVVLGRLEKATDISALTTGRSGMWVSYLQAFISKVDFFIIGSGVSAPDVLGIDVHNFYIELLYYFGVLGTLLYLLMYIEAVKSNRYTNKSGFVGVLGMIAILAMYFFLQYVHFNETAFHFGVAFSIYALTPNLKERKIENDQEYTAILKRESS